MPTSLIHLKIGYEHAQKHKEYDNKQFYLGLIAPDAVNLNGFAEKEKRWGAHLRDKNLEIWKNNILNFYKENKEKNGKSYIYGYLVHVLTDIYFDEKNSNEIFPKIELKVGKEKSREEYSKQMDLYECSQIEEEWWKYVEQQLKQSKAETINEIQEQEIEAWKNVILDRYNQKTKDEYEIITPEYLIEIKNELEKYIKKANI